MTGYVRRRSRLGRGLGTLSAGLGYATSVGPYMPGSVAWKSKEEQSRHATGCSISRSSPPKAFDKL